MLVNSNEILNLALKKGYAVGAYNINNLEWAKYILQACSEDKCPAILAATPSAIEYMGGYNVVASVVKSLIKDLDIKIPVVLHLDHGKTVESCKKAIDAGFTSVMIDSSSKPLSENIADTIEVLKYAREKNVGVEAEIGNINEDENITIEEEARDFYNQTGVDFLAPSIGNKHGIYEEGYDLDFDLLGAICKQVKIPLVLHGGSGLDENKIKAAIFCGVAKININTDLQLAWANEVRKYLDFNKDVYDPRKIISSGENAIKKIVHEKNRMFNSNNRAN